MLALFANIVLAIISLVIVAVVLVTNLFTSRKIPYANII